MLHKNLNIGDIDLKFTEDGRKFSGYASVFGGVDSYGDTIMPGAYKATIGERARPIQMRWNHHGPVIGKWLKIEEDDKGLFVEGELTRGHSTAEDAYALLKHGAVSGMSIGYRPVKQVDNQTGGVDLHEIDLVEISVVESPADNSAHISDIKSAEKLKDIESVLRSKGFSHKEATEIVVTVKKIVHGERELEKAAAEQAVIEEIKQFEESYK